MKRGGALKHGMSKTPLYQVWAAMRNRCYNKNTKGWHNYGGRGITVCPRWRCSFANFYADMAPSYKKGLWLDRKDNDKNYTPKNCTWSNVKTQSTNRRTTQWMETPWGVLSTADAAERVGISKVAMAYRKNNWPQERWFEAATK